MSSESSRIRNVIRSVLERQKLAVLATAGHEYPYCTLVGFAYTKDLRSIVFATVRDTHKFKNIQADTNVSLLIDTRTNSVDDFKDATAVTALGTAGEVSGTRRGTYRRLYLARHPHLRDFVDSPNTALVRVAVCRYIVVQRFQEVRELDIV